MEIKAVDFNPHSREGSDINNVKDTFHPLYFNPHSREGSDTSKPLHFNSLDISIHTPAKGVT